MKGMLLVFLGSGSGGCIRYLISLSIRPFSLGSSFPWTTLLSNLLACLLAGFLSARFTSGSAVDDQQRLLWITGFCGGFSTFSAFGLESIQLIREGSWPTALAYITLSLAGGLAGIWIFLRTS